MLKHRATNDWLLVLDDNAVGLWRPAVSIVIGPLN